ncbi:MAG: hypothetical protein IT353_11875 [Gemmatimonadaceae bacterium]|nr:hypothetical protein [Gemmatimonadaceae bacterium]
MVGLEKQRRMVACALACLTSVLLAPSTGAQIMSNPGQWYINNQIYSTRVFNGVVANSMFRGSSAGKARPSSVKPSGPAAPEPTQFRESATTTIPALLSGKSAGLAGTSDDARRLFTSYIDLYKTTARTDRFPANDLAYAMEYYVVNNWQIYHDLVSVPLENDPRALRAKDGFDRIAVMAEKKTLQVSPYQERAVYEQFRAKLGASADVRAMTDAQKQEATELLATLFGVNFAVYMQGVNARNDRVAQQGRDMARQGLEKLLGVPINKMRITNNGLELDK